MQIELQESVVATFGAIRVGVLSATNLSLTPAALCGLADVVAILETQILAQLPAVPPDAGLPAIVEWRDIYSRMGASPRRLSSVESLWRCVLEQQRLPRILPLVDLYNAISVRYCLPMAGYDARQLQGQRLVLRHARKGEEFLPLGFRQIEKTKSGEVIYADAEKVVCRYWNHKDCDGTKLSANVQDVLFIIDGAPSVPDELILAALHDLEQALLQAEPSAIRTGLLMVGQPLFAID
jgi:lysyl-tRNA synthetase class 2